MLALAAPSFAQMPPTGHNSHAVAVREELNLPAGQASQLVLAGRAAYCPGMQLVSDGGVHSHIKHFDALLKLAQAEKVNKVYIHAFLDGRDTPPRSAEKYIKYLQASCNKHQVGQIISICGRFYAMDRDNRWERTEAAFNLSQFPPRECQFR